METICIFAGSSVGNRKIYSDTAKDLATSIIDHGYKIVFGAEISHIIGYLYLLSLYTHEIHVDATVKRFRS